MDALYTEAHLPFPPPNRLSLMLRTHNVCAGINLPGEQLVGRQPPSVSAKTERAYLSNVCVAKAVRRLVIQYT